MHRHIAVAILAPGLAHRAAQYPVFNVCFDERLASANRSNGHAAALA
jgi:hypothetical protein